MKVHLFFRKRTSGFRSIEELFDIVVAKLKNASCDIFEVPEKRVNLTKFLTNIRWVRKHRGQINHITGDVHYIALVTGRNTVLTIHDANSSFSGSVLKKFFIKLFWFWLPALLVKRITTISEKSKREIEQIIPFAKNKILVIPNPYNPKLLALKSSPDGEHVTNTAKPIVLHLGTKANKNLERTIQALEGLPYKLYIIGQLTESQANLLGEHNIDFSAYFNLPYSEVATLYHQCAAICFASLYEGFGMPIIEAQLVGKPVITSNLEPMPWVAGNEGACIVDPYNVASIRAGVIKVIEDKQYRKRIVENGLKNVQRFDPVKIARMYEDVYNEVLR